MKHRLALLLFALALAGCGGGPVAPAWEGNAKYSLDAFEDAYLRGDTRVAAVEFARAKAELSGTGNPALMARAELIRCAVRAASLEFDDCPAFEALRADAGQEEVVYADFLAGRATRAAADEPLSRLVNFGIQFKSGKSTPQTISAAIDISSAQAWRRPLLAWLGVEEKRAQAAGDEAALERIRRRIAIASGKS